MDINNGDYLQATLDKRSFSSVPPIPCQTCIGECLYACTLRSSLRPCEISGSDLVQCTGGRGKAFGAGESPHLLPAKAESGGLASLKTADGALMGRWKRNVFLGGLWLLTNLSVLFPIILPYELVILLVSLRSPLWTDPVQLFNTLLTTLYGNTISPRLLKCVNIKTKYLFVRVSQSKHCRLSLLKL